MIPTNILMRGVEGWKIESRVIYKRSLIVLELDIPQKPNGEITNASTFKIDEHGEKNCNSAW